MQYYCFIMPICAVDGRISTAIRFPNSKFNFISKFWELILFQSDHKAYPDLKKKLDYNKFPN